MSELSKHEGFREKILKPKLSSEKRSKVAPVPVTEVPLPVTPDHVLKSETKSDAIPLEEITLPPEPPIGSTGDILSQSPIRHNSSNTQPEKHPSMSYIGLQCSLTVDNSLENNISPETHQTPKMQYSR